MLKPLPGLAMLMSLRALSTLSSAILYSSWSWRTRSSIMLLGHAGDVASEVSPELLKLRRLCGLGCDQAAILADILGATYHIHIAHELLELPAGQRDVVPGEAAPQHHWPQPCDLGMLPEEAMIRACLHRASSP